jgi:hypothetical protein
MYYNKNNTDLELHLKFQNTFHFDILSNNFRLNVWTADIDTDSEGYTWNKK